MRQVFKKIPVYTGDVSGVCSALFELGGMIVMHDPSGCNSTYNTHDETRWYDHDSLIFISGLNEMEAIMGSDENLIRDITESARIYSPKFIAIASSPVPYIIGMDFDAVSRLVENETGIPTFYITTNGMHDYSRGIGQAFLRLAERFVDPPPDSGEQTAGPDEMQDRPLRCNILGMTPLDFAAPACLDSLCAKIEEKGMEKVSCWAMGDTLEEIRKSAAADINLVIASSGLPAAQYMFRKFHIPFVAGIPAAGAETIYFDAVRTAVRTGRNRFPFRNLRICPHTAASEQIPVCFIGEPVIMTSLAASVQLRTGARTHVYGSTEGAEIFLGTEDAVLCGEEELEEALRKAAESCSGTVNTDTDTDTGSSPAAGENADKSPVRVKVVADPCYRDVLPPACGLISLPHLAFSGRILLKDIPDLMQFAVEN